MSHQNLKASKLSLSKANLYQLLVFILLFIAIALLIRNTLSNMQLRGIHGGFGFLSDTAGFGMSESWINFDASDSYALAFLSGLINTLRVSVCCIMLSTLLGTLLGLGRTCASPLLRALCYAYTELFRNIPLLIQLLIWYVLMVEWLPDPLHPFRVSLWPSNLWPTNLEPLAVTLSKEGLTFPWISLGGEPLIESSVLSPEFMALTLGLALYTAAFISEVVRSGISSLPKTQLQAALSLGLKPAQVQRFVVLPQALRVIIPPLSNQYLNLIKNSSLAVAIGYPDLVNVSNTAINQTGHAVECVAIIMLVYLSLSLAVSSLMNYFNHRVMARG